MRHRFRRSVISNHYHKGMRRLQQPIQRLLLILLKRGPKSAPPPSTKNNKPESKLSVIARLKLLLYTFWRLPPFRFIRKIGRVLLGPPHRLIVIPLLKRARDPEPEAIDLLQPSSAWTRFLSNTWIWLPTLALLSVLGLLLIAYGFNISRNVGPSNLRDFFYPGILLIFVPTTARIITPFPSRIERICLVSIAWINCFLLKVLTAPLYFFLYDEFLHWRTENDIIKTHHLFTINSLLPVSPFYPGLEIITNAFCSLSGLDVFHSALILIGIARLMLALTLFAINEQLFRSARTASIATIFYMVNQHFLFFASQYAYESLALPLALTVFLVMAPYQSLSTQLNQLNAAVNAKIFLPASIAATMEADRKEVRSDRYAITLLSFMILASVTVSHHATDFFIIGLLMLWAGVHRFLRLSGLFSSSLTWLGVGGLAFAIGWINYPGNTVVPYLSGFLSTIFAHAGKHFAGGASVNSYAPMTWEKNLALYTTYFLLAIMPFGWLCIWQRYRSNSLALMQGLVSMGLHASQVLRTSDNGIQLADRASATLFVSVGTIMAVFITQFWPVRQLRWFHVCLIVGVMTILYMDGYISSGGSGYGSPPTPYVVGADSRSLEMQGIEAAKWSAIYLGSNNHIGTDRTNQLLMGTFGDQRIIDTIQDHIDVSPIFFSLPLDAESRELLQRGQIRYLVVDRRLSESLPAVGVYFEKGEPGAMMHATPINIKALMKFDTMPNVNKVFDGGAMVIFDVRKLSNAP
jgi:hypothetical protein